MTDISWTPEQVERFFNHHWTVRKYKQIVMPPSHLKTILAAAQRAPTDATAQMYSFIRLTDPALRKEIAESTNNPHFVTASEAFIICADVYRLDEILKVHGYEPGTYPNVAIHFAIGDAVLAGQNMLIAAELLGYQGCWIGGVLNALQKISQGCELPEGVFPFAGLTIGVPDEPQQHRPRLPQEHVIHENRYCRPSDESLKAGAKVMGPITARGDWPGTLARYFARGGGMEQRDIVLNELLNQKIRGRQ